MGSCIPYAVGAALAHPDKTILAIDGDGSFNMTMQDCKTIQRYGLNNIKIAIMNDGWLSMVKTWEKLFFNEHYVATENVANPDYVKLG